MGSTVGEFPEHAASESNNRLFCENSLVRDLDLRIHRINTTNDIFSGWFIEMKSVLCLNDYTNSPCECHGTSNRVSF